MVQVQKWPFFQLFFLGNIAQENVFYDILERKNDFLGNKNKKFKKSKNCHFPKGLTHGFPPKMAILPPFFQPIQARKMSVMIFQNEQTPFQAIKTRRVTSRQIDIFPKGLTDGFGQKMAVFPIFFFQSIQARKMSFMIFYNEKTPFQAIKTRSSKSRKIDIFPKGLTHDFGPKMPFFHFLFFRQYRPGKCLL